MKYKCFLLIVMVLLIFLSLSTSVYAEYDSVNFSSILTAYDMAGVDYFGTSVSISGNYLIIGSYYDDDKGTNSGSAYIFFKNESGAWNFSKKLTASDGASNDYFGYSVDIFEDYAVVGAYGDDTSAGSAYFFKRNDTDWVQINKVTAISRASNDYFGRAVSLYGDYAVVGAYADDDNMGSVHIFKKNSSDSWQYYTKLTAFDRASYDQFGTSVSIYGEYVMVGAPLDNDKGSDSGSVYVYFKNETDNWNFLRKLNASDGVAGDKFGNSLFIENSSLIVGADSDDDMGSASGSAYIFNKSSSNEWIEESKLTAIDGAEADYFGSAVSIYEDYAVVGVYADDDNGTSSGSAYVFHKNSTGYWNQMSKLIANDGSSNYQFGNSVGINEEVISIGSKQWNSSRGAVYLFELFENVSEAPSEPAAEPNATNFNISYGSTNFSAVENLSSVPAMTLATANSKVVWINTVNASGQDYDSNINLGDNFISLNVSALDQSINSSANVSMKVSGCNVYSIYHAVGFYEDFESLKGNGTICNEWTSPSCTNVVCADNVLNFTAEHFDGFGGEGDNAIPEFSDYLMMLALGLVGGGMFLIRREN